MLNRALIVSTCGTSLLTNRTKPEMRSFLNRNTNANKDDLTEQDASQLSKYIDQRRSELVGGNADISKARRLSAELNGIAGLYEGQFERGKQDQHILLQTDTWQGQEVVGILSEWLNLHHLQVATQKIDDLNTKDLGSFHAGLNYLVSWCEQTLPGYRTQGYRIIFNLVGGFKSLQGFMQTLGMFYADEMIYIFEGSDQLLRIPRLPIEFEAAARHAIEKNLSIFRRLDQRTSTLPASECQQDLGTFLFTIGDEVELSPWGRLVWERHRCLFYRNHVLDPLSRLLQFSAQTRKKAEDLDASSRERFNKRMDDLSYYLDSDRKLPTQRLDFKRLKGDPCPPSTHECDLWSDRDAWRAFGHFTGETFLVDSIGPALH